MRYILCEVFYGYYEVYYANGYYRCLLVGFEFCFLDMVFGFYFGFFVYFLVVFDDCSEEEEEEEDLK